MYKSVVADSPLGLAEIEVLYRQHKAAVFHRCLRLLSGNEDAAMDAMHQTFVRAIKFKNTYRQESDPIRWLFAIAFRVSMDQLKAKKRLIPVPDAGEKLEDVERDRTELAFDVRLDEQRTVARLLGHFDEETQEIIVLRYFDELGVREIAERLHSSERTVARRLAEFLARARELLG